METNPMSRKLSTVVAAVIVFAIAAPIFAHHSFSAEYDNTKPITIKGKFTKMDWVNPHSWVHVDVDMPDGKTMNWAAERHPPNVLYRGGWRKDTLKPGQEVEIQGFSAKDGKAHMWASRVIDVPTGQAVLTMFAPNPNAK